MLEKLDPWFEKCEHFDNRLMKISQDITNWWTYKTGRSNLDFAYLFVVLGFATLGALAADVLNVDGPFSSTYFVYASMIDFVLYGAILIGLMKLEEMLKPTAKRPVMNPLREYKWGGVCRMTLFFFLLIVILDNVLKYTSGTEVRWQAIAWMLSLVLLSYFASCTPPPYRPQRAQARRTAVA